MDTPIITDTQWFNEEETDWDTVISQMASETSSFSAGGDEGLTAKVTRNEKDDYSVAGVSITDQMCIRDRSMLTQEQVMLK